ncbi:MAG: GIY-YIG nuclease family protein [Chloroflexi bacterium]|nr:GIY-YIG nuclease family protein [Chloroflexota bacterium]
MKVMIFSGASFLLGVLVASHFGLPVAIGTVVGAAIGAVITAVAGKNRVIGALIGAVVVSSALFLFHSSGRYAPRCEFDDPGTLPPTQHPAGYVYVIQDVDISKYYKIGRTNNPFRRFNEFALALPFEIEVVAVIQTEDAPTLEWQLHQRYAEQRQRGEWFKLHDSHVREICNI